MPRCPEGKSGKQKKLAPLRQLLFLIRFFLPASGSVASGGKPNYRTSLEVFEISLNQKVGTAF
jgi:hypothetical protein